MTRDEAEAVRRRLAELAGSPRIGDAGRFELLELDVAEHDASDWLVRVVFRQGDGPAMGLRQRSLFSLVEGDRVLTPDEMAGDLYDFVLVEPHDPQPLRPDAQEVRWFEDAD